MASGIFPAINCAWPTVKSALPRELGESSFREMESASFAVFATLSAVDLKSFSLPFPSSSRCTCCISSTRQVKIMLETSSSRSPSSFAMPSSEPKERSAASKSLSCTCTFTSVRSAWASPSWFWDSLQQSCASRAEAAACLPLPSRSCAEETSSRAWASPSASLASRKRSLASAARASARPCSLRSRYTSARACSVSACSRASSRVSKMVSASCVTRNARSFSPLARWSAQTLRRTRPWPRLSPASSSVSAARWA
mmetsp:Transcript_38969/g.111190  ORF Transcript_38969/g.111190 Transcript_38969/m.111190 type:complete len:255 (+) Transcript_38969:596-1360(+)